MSIYGNEFQYGTLCRHQNSVGIHVHQSLLWWFPLSKDSRPYTSFSINVAMGQNPVPPVNIPIPTKICSKMGGEFTYPRKWDPKTVFGPPRPWFPVETPAMACASGARLTKPLVGSRDPSRSFRNVDLPAMARGGFRAERLGEGGGQLLVGVRVSGWRVGLE